MKYLAFIIFVLSIVSCQSPVKKPNLEDELNALTSNQLRKEYLEAIYYSDQGARNGDKPAHEIYATDAINREKIVGYLTKYGYPPKEKFGHWAILAPWLVIHHQPMKDTAIRRQFFGEIYQAYLDGVLNDSAVSLYLNRLYEAEKGHRFIIESPYMPQDELDQLMALLQLRSPQ